MATRRVTNRQSDDPGPCHRCAAALSIAADAPTYLSIGSHARSGLRMRRSPRGAVPVRTSKWRFAVGHGRHQSRSLAERPHPSRSFHERLEPSATAGDHRNANGWGLLRRGACAYGEPRIGSSGQTGSGKRYQRFSAPQELRSCRACSGRTPSMGCASVGHRDSGSPINKRKRMCVGPC